MRRSFLCTTFLEMLLIVLCLQSTVGQQTLPLALALKSNKETNPWAFIPGDTIKILLTAKNISPNETSLSKLFVKIYNFTRPIFSSSVDVDRKISPNENLTFPPVTILGDITRTILWGDYTIVVEATDPSGRIVGRTEQRVEFVIATVTTRLVTSTVVETTTIVSSWMITTTHTATSLTTCTCITTAYGIVAAPVPPDELAAGVGFWFFLAVDVVFSFLTGLNPSTLGAFVSILSFFLGPLLSSGKGPGILYANYWLFAVTTALFFTSGRVISRLTSKCFADRTKRFRKMSVAWKNLDDRFKKLRKLTARKQ